MKRSRYQSWGLPLAIGLVVALMAWVGLSALFSTDQPREGEITNTVSRPLPSTGSPQAGLDQTGLEETGLDRTSSGQATGAAPAAPGGRPSLVADSPMVQAALKVSPISSRLDSGGVGQGLIKTYPPKIIAQPPAPAIPPSTAAQPKPAAKPTAPAAPAAAATPAPQAADPTAVSATGEELPVPATAPATASGLRFTVHLASFELKANADRALAELQAAGVPAFLTRIELDGKTYFRLMAGQFNSQPDADAYGQQLVAKGLTRNMGDPVAKPLYVAPAAK
jgi:cell division septation protein DedD